MGGGRVGGRARGIKRDSEGLKLQAKPESKSTSYYSTPQSCTATGNLLLVDQGSTKVPDCL